MCHYRLWISCVLQKRLDIFLNFLLLCCCCRLHPPPVTLALITKRFFYVHEDWFRYTLLNPRASSLPAEPRRQNVYACWEALRGVEFHRRESNENEKKRKKTAATEFSLPTVVRIDSKGFVLIAFNKKV